MPNSGSSPSAYSKVGGEFSAEERSWLREQMRRQMLFQQNAQAAGEFCRKHRGEYHPTSQNGAVLDQIVKELGGTPVGPDSKFDPDLYDRAFEIGIARDLLELPPAESMSAARLQDNRVAGSKEKVATQQEAERAANPPQRISTGMSAGGGVQGPELSDELSMADIANEIRTLPYEQARVRMSQLMNMSRNGQPPIPETATARPFPRPRC